MTRLEQLMQVHYAFVESAKLPEATRPYGIQGRLDNLQKEIIEEINTNQAPSKPATTSDDDIPF